jgi:Lar family restriction alleviation protein
MSTDLKLKPCPFCGETDIELRDNGEPYYAYCTSCSCDGPLHETWQEAFDAWNRRTS